MCAVGIKKKCIVAVYNLSVKVNTFKKKSKIAQCMYPVL